MIQQVDLYKPEFRPQRLLLSFSHMVAAAGLTVVVCVAATLILKAQVSADRDTLAALTADEARLGNQVSSLEETLSARAPDETLAMENRRMTETLRRGSRFLAMLRSRDDMESVRVSMAGMMEGLANNHLPGVSLTGFSFEYDRNLTISGLVTDAEKLPRYIRMLGNAPVFDGIRFDELIVGDESPGQPGMEFRLATSTEEVAAPTVPLTGELVP